MELEVLTSKMKRFPMKGGRFLGKGSTFVLFQTALDHKEETTGGGREGIIKPHRQEFFCPHAVSGYVCIYLPPAQIRFIF
jgi:hypothetical protein